MRIDVHAHHTPTWYVDALVAGGGDGDLSILRAMSITGSDAGAAPGGPTSLGEVLARANGPDESAVRRRIDDLDSAGVDVQVIGIGAIQPYLADDGSAVAITRRLNDEYAELVAAGGGRLAGFAALPLPHVAEAVAEAERVRDAGWALGFAVGASAGGVPIDDPRFADLWAVLDARSAVVHLHPGAEIGGVPGCTDLHLAPDFVSPAEMAVAAARLVTTGMLERYPGIRWVLATLGGSLPFLARRHDDGLRRTQPELHERLGGFLRHLPRFWVDASVLEEPDAMRAAVETFGADRILLGSDVGRPGASARDAVAYVERSTHLTAEQKIDVLGRSAEALLPLDLLTTRPSGSGA